MGAGTGLKTALLTGCMLLSLAMFTCRLVSNTTNFGGKQLLLHYCYTD